MENYLIFLNVRLSRLTILVESPFALSYINHTFVSFSYRVSPISHQLGSITRPLLYFSPLCIVVNFFYFSPLCILVPPKMVCPRSATFSGKNKTRLSLEVSGETHWLLPIQTNKDRKLHTLRDERKGRCGSRDKSNFMKLLSCNVKRRENEHVLEGHSSVTATDWPISNRGPTSTNRHDGLFRIAGPYH